VTIPRPLLPALRTLVAGSAPAQPPDAIGQVPPALVLTGGRRPGWGRPHPLYPRWPMSPRPGESVGGIKRKFGKGLEERRANADDIPGHLPDYQWLFLEVLAVQGQSNAARKQAPKQDNNTQRAALCCRARGDVCLQGRVSCLG
ncbi:hypothetical protein H1C71_022150, partial [Ictidomys tridecemlineatus]